jgi:predicted esterase
VPGKRPSAGALAAALWIAAGCLPLERAAAPGETVSFAFRSPESSLERFAARMEWPAPTPADREANDYELAQESFELHVPEACRRVPGCGVLVWVSASDSGHLPRAWRRPLEQARLVWVGANRSGDARALAVRVNLALDASANAARLLAAPAQRVYVAGFAGGGRAASAAALLYPEVFSGGLFFGGADFFAAAPAADPGREPWLPAFPPPPAPLRERAAERGRYVLVAGTRDPNLAELQDLARAFRAQGFRHVELLELWGLGHAPPGGAAFARALALLDAPRRAP